MFYMPLTADICCTVTFGNHITHQREESHIALSLTIVPLNPQVSGATRLNFPHTTLMRFELLDFLNIKHTCDHITPIL